MTKEFKKIIRNNETHYVLEDASAGATSAGSIASVAMPLGSMRRRIKKLREKIEKVSVPTAKPRNPTGMGTTPGRGTQTHANKKRDQKIGTEKHKKPFYEQLIDELEAIAELKNTMHSIDDSNKPDHEISMASSELQSIAADAANLLDMVRQRSEEEGLEAWQQSKITKAADFMNSVLQSIRGDEEQGVAEGSDHDDDYSTASFEKWKKQKEYEKEYDKKKPAKPIVPDNKDKKKGVAEGLNEFAPDGFNGGDDGEEFSPNLAKMAQEDGFTKGVSLADGATLERAMTINHWHSQHGGMYKQYFAKGFKAGRMNKINHDNKQYNLNLKLMKDGSIRHGEQGATEGYYGDMDQERRRFKSAELQHELGHERNNYAVIINGRTWKVFADRRQAENIARSLQSKGKDASVSITGADPTSENSINELSKDTLRSYSKSAGHDVAADQRDAGSARTQAVQDISHGKVKKGVAWDDEADWLEKRAEKRAGGIAKATTKIAKKGVEEGQPNPSVLANKVKGELTTGDLDSALTAAAELGDTFPFDNFQQYINGAKQARDPESAAAHEQAALKLLNAYIAKSQKHMLARTPYGMAEEHNDTFDKKSHQYSTTIKHADRPTVQQRMAAHDIKPGVAGYRDRIDLLKDLERTGRLKDKGVSEDPAQKYSVIIDAIDHGVLGAITVSASSPAEAKQKVIAGVKKSMANRGYELMVRSVKVKPVQGMAEGSINPYLARIEKDVRELIAMGDYDAAKDHADLAPTADGRMYLHKIVKKLMSKPELGQTTEPKKLIDPKLEAKRQMIKMYRKGDITFSKSDNGGYFVQHEDEYGDTHAHQYDPKTGKVNFSSVTRSGGDFMEQGVAEGSTLLPKIIEMIKKIAASSATPEHKKAAIDALVAKHSQQEMAENLRDPKDNPCWKGYKPVGTKKKGGRTVPNCVPTNEDSYLDKLNIMLKSKVK